MILSTSLYGELDARYAHTSRFAPQPFETSSDFDGRIYVL